MITRKNPVNGTWGASSFELNDGSRNTVGLWSESWTGPEFAKMADAYDALCSFANARNLERMEAKQRKSKELQRNQPVVVRESEERAVTARLKQVKRDAQQARQLAQQALDAVTDRETKLTLSTLHPPSDYASAIKRERIRTKLEQMTPAQLTEALREPSREVQQALFEVPPAFSGIPPERWIGAYERAHAIENGEALAQIAAQREAAEVLDRAARSAEPLLVESLTDNLRLSASDAKEALESL